MFITKEYKDFISPIYKKNMDFSKFATEKLTNATTNKSYTATYNAHLSQFADDNGVIHEDKIPAIMEYITTSNRRHSTKNCMLVILTRMMLYAGIDKSLMTDVKHQFNSTPKVMPSIGSEIDQYIERLFKCGNLKSFVLNTILYNYDIEESELRGLEIVNRQPTIRCTGIFVRPNYVTIQSKNYPQFRTHGIKKVRLHSARCREFFESMVGKQLLEDGESITDYTMNGLSKSDYETALLNELVGTKRSEYLKYR
jgi:hypothetical protein